MGRPEESLALAELAIKQAGRHTEHDVRIVGWSNVALGRFDVALSACEKTAALSNNWWRDEMMLVALYAITGATEKAAVARAELLRLQPTLTIALWRCQRYRPPRLPEVVGGNSLRGSAESRCSCGVGRRLHFSRELC